MKMIRPWRTVRESMEAVDAVKRRSCRECVRFGRCDVLGKADARKPPEWVIALDSDGHVTDATCRAQQL